MKKILLGLVILCVMASNAFASQTITITKRENLGGTRVTYGIAQYALESYTTGGVEITAKQLGLDNLKIVSITGLGSAVFSYNYDYTNSKMLLYYSNNSEGKPATSPVTSDYFIVTDDNSAASNGKLVCVSAYGAASGGLLCYLDAMGGSSSDLLVSVIAAADSSTTLMLSDTVGCPVGLRAGVCGGDTLFFDDDATYAYDRLMYSGSSLGDMGTIYIPYGNGNFVRVLKKTNSQITQAAALPLYFDEDAGLDDKLLSVTDGDANSTFSIDWKYTSLPGYYQLSSTELENGASYSVTFRFIAMGN